MAACAEEGAIRWRDRLIEAGALFLLVFTPLAYGTVEPWAEAIAELVVLGMVLVWLLGMLRDWELRIDLPPGWLPIYLFLGPCLPPGFAASRCSCRPGLAVDPRPSPDGRGVRRRLEPPGAALPRAARDGAGGPEARRRRRLLPRLLQHLPDAPPGAPCHLDDDRDGQPDLRLRCRPAHDVERSAVLGGPRVPGHQCLRPIRQSRALCRTHRRRRADGPRARGDRRQERAAPAGPRLARSPPPLEFRAERPDAPDPVPDPAHGWRCAGQRLPGRSPGADGSPSWRWSAWVRRGPWAPAVRRASPSLPCSSSSRRPGSAATSSGAP